MDQKGKRRKKKYKELHGSPFDNLLKKNWTPWYFMLVIFLETYPNQTLSAIFLYSIRRTPSNADNPLHQHTLDYRTISHPG